MIQDFAQPVNDGITDSNQSQPGQTSVSASPQPPAGQEQTTMVTSRLAKREKSKIWKQTAALVVAAIGLFVLFLFVLLPQVVRFAGNVIETGSLTEPADNVPPQTPILSAPVSATNSAQLPINGVGEPGAQAVLVLNGERLEELEIDEDGTFSFEVPLEEGENNFSVYSIDEAGNESVESREYPITLDTEDPNIIVDQPENGSTIELRKNQLTTISGSTEPNARVYINGRLVVAGSEGQFRTTYQLAEGENKLEIRAVDQAGNESELELTVTFRL